MTSAAGDLAQLVRRYSIAAAAHGAAKESGSYKKANKQHDIIAGIYRELRARGLEAQLALLDLLDDPNPSVRGWAAAHALEFAPARGELVLRELARRMPGLIGLGAEMTLREWRKGALRFP